MFPDKTVEGWFLARRWSNGLTCPCCSANVEAKVVHKAVLLRYQGRGYGKRFSTKHIGRYVNEFVGRHSVRECDAGDMIGTIADGTRGKRLCYRELVA